MNRNHKSYFGRIVDFTDDFQVPVKGAFFILDTISYMPSQTVLSMVFAGWASTEAFEAGVPAIPSARREYKIEGEEFKAFKETNSANFLEIQDTLREFANLSGENFRFDGLTVCPTESYLVATFSKGTSLRIIREEKESYDALIAENAEIVGAIVRLAWTKALKTDDFFLNAVIIEGK